MRTRAQVLQKIHQVRFYHWKRIADRGLRQMPHNCKHSQERSFDGQDMNVCTRHRETGVYICDSRIPFCVTQAKACPFYEGVHTKEDLRAGFDELVSGPWAKLAEGYPDLAALMWVVGDGAKDDVLSGGSLEVPEEPPQEEPPQEEGLVVKAQGGDPDVEYYNHPSPTLWARAFEYLQTLIKRAGGPAERA